MMVHSEIEIPQLFIDNKDNTLYVLGDVACSFCGENCERIAHYKVEYGHRTSSFRMACNSCCGKLSRPKILNCKAISADMLIIVPEIPLNARPYFLRPPEFKENNNVDVWSAADPEYDKFIGTGESGVKIVDNTRLVGRPDVKGVLEVEKHKKLIDKKEAELDDASVDVDAFFDDVKKSKIVVDGNENLLEKKSQVDTQE